MSNSEKQHTHIIPILAGATTAILLMAAGAGTVYAADFNEAQTQYEVAVQSARQSHINLAKQVKAVQKTDKIPAGQLLGKDHDLVSRMDSAMLGAKGQLKENIAHNPDAGRMSISQIRELTETIKNQDSANISSSSMLNRLDSYIKESQHYKQLDDARGKVKDSIGKASQLLETSKDNVDDEAPRQALQKTMDAAKDWKKSTDLTWLKKQADVINSKIQPVKDAVSAHEQRLAQEAQAAAVQSSYQTSSTANSLNASTYTNPVYTGNAPAYQPTQPADNGYTYTPSTTCGDGGWNLRAQCQAAIDQGGLVEMPIFDGLGGSRLIAGHNSTGAGWIGQLQQGQSTPYGIVQQVWHNATPDTINNSGIGTYLQTCDQNGNPIVVKVG